MKILYFSNPIDPAGVSVNMACALTKHTEHECRYAIEQRTYVVDMDKLKKYGIGTILLDERGGVEDLQVAMDWCDVVHVNASMASWPFTLHGNIDVEKMLGDKGIVYHTHGGAWLLDPDWICDWCEAINAVMVTCSPLDEIVAPGITWVPNVLPDYIKPAARDWDGELICGQACGDPLYKGGQIVEYVFEWMHKIIDKFNSRYELVVSKPYLESIEIRKKHHMTIDNWTQGFHGMAALEGMALGHATFSRFHPLAREKWDGFSDDPIPIIDVAGMDEFSKWLRIFDNDHKKLREYGEISREWIEENYTEAKVIDRWVHVYRDALIKRQNSTNKKKPIRAMKKIPPPRVAEILGQLYLNITEPGVPVVGYDLAGLTVTEASDIIAESYAPAFIVCKVPAEGEPHIYEILKRTDRKLFRFLKNVMQDGSSLFSWEPKCKNKK